MCLAHELLGEQFKEAVLELNASDERGIDVVRNDIKQFASKKVALPAGKHKIVILDEADSMTTGAQQALRRIMEVHASTTRFALACNTSSKLIEPIQSRCAILRYGRLPSDQILNRLVHICKTEAVSYSPDGLEAILFTAEGDMRQAINCLQATWTGAGFVSAEQVWRVCDQPHPAIVEQIISLCIEGKLGEAQGHLEQLADLGYASVDLIATFFRVLKAMQKEKIDEAMQLDFIKEIGTSHMRALEGSDGRLQLAGMLANLCLQAKGPLFIPSIKV